LDLSPDKVGTAPRTTLSVFSLLEWLNGEPSFDEVCRGVVLAYMHQFNPSNSQVLKLSGDDSLHVLGEYGFINSVGHAAKIITPAQWRQNNSDFSRLLGMQDRFYWNRSNTTVIVPFTKHGIVSGAITIGFDAPQRDTSDIGMMASQLGQAIALYVNLVSNETKSVETTQRNLLDSNVAVSNAFNNRFNSEVKQSGPPLTPRQIDILQSLIEGKTNYDIASDLGYSVSTIRQETIKIYSMLNVSGRRAAAQEALRQQIV
jgi:DNA-binding CsgD family transcriptional regulator